MMTDYHRHLSLSNTVIMLIRLNYMDWLFYNHINQLVWYANHLDNGLALSQLLHSGISLSGSFHFLTADTGGNHNAIPNLAVNLQYNLYFSLNGSCFLILRPLLLMNTALSYKNAPQLLRIWGANGASIFRRFKLTSLTRPPLMVLLSWNHRRHLPAP